MGRILAIDFGKKRTGLAVTDPLQIIATGLKTVETEKVLDFLKKYVVQENVECFVVGLPLNLDGTPTDATFASNEFVKKLQKLFPNIPIEREDERYTSKMAARTLVLSGVKKKKRRNKKLLDEVSATIILQSYLGHHTEMF
ncbi:MAG: Holliday junction resolvase RuvX [Chitinophagales bacterium]